MARPSPRAAPGVSATVGLPPARENRPATGVSPGPKTAARDRAAALPLLMKWPTTDTPLAWFFRNPG
ncbi:Uncharacterised protein [Mycobacteroides abscessus subsp. abscessus]|nr:Uncharacterised protein [Mycobacteroides abscessus subsp. abscessus]